MQQVKFLDVPRSGSYQGITSSRNRNGQYVRTRAQPVQPRSASQLAVRSNLAANAASWRALTATQRDGWTSLGLQMTRTDGLGQSQNLTGFQAYVSVNNLNKLVGNAVVGDPPAITTPSALTTVTPTITGGGSPAFSIAFTPTPLGAGLRVIIRASPQRSAGRSFESDFRVMFIGAAASASPSNILTAYQAKFGTPITGGRIFISAAVYQLGFESIPFIASAVVT
jgi:hypothetical protein